MHELTKHPGGALLWITCYRDPAAYRGPFHSLRTSDTLQNLTRAIKGAPGGIESVGTTEVAETREGSPALIVSHDILLPPQYRLQKERNGPLGLRPPVVSGPAALPICKEC